MEKKTRKKSKLLITLSKMAISILVIIFIVLIGMLIYSRKVEKENSKSVDIYMILDTSISEEKILDIRNKIYDVCGEDIGVTYIPNEDSEYGYAQYKVTLKLKGSSEIIDKLNNIRGIERIEKFEKF